MAPTIRRFVLERSEDVSGVSGTGIVAEGCVFSDGAVVMRWTSEWPTSVVWHDRGVESLEHVHGHNGRTRIVWVDAEGPFHSVPTGMYEDVNRLRQAARTEAGVLRLVVRRLLDGWEVGDNCDPDTPDGEEWAWERCSLAPPGSWVTEREPFEDGVDEVLRSFDPAPANGRSEP